MKVALKKFKIKRLTKMIETESFFIMCNVSSIKSENSLKFAQEMLRLKLDYYRVNTKLLKHIFKSSMFKNYTNCISGTVVIIKAKEKELDVNFRTILNLFRLYDVNMFGLYLSPNVYSFNQVKEMSFLNHKKNVSFFRDSLINFLRIPCSKFIKEKP